MSRTIGGELLPFLGLKKEVQEMGVTHGGVVERLRGGLPHQDKPSRAASSLLIRAARTRAYISPSMNDVIDSDPIWYSRFHSLTGSSGLAAPSTTGSGSK